MISFRHLLTGTLIAIWCTALSGLLLDLAPSVLVTAHLLSAALGGVPLIAFLARHWWVRRAQVRQHRNARLGYIALGSLLSLLVSGLALIVWTNIAALRWLHNAAMVVLLLDLTVHMAWRLRVKRSDVTLSPSRLPTSAIRWLATGGFVGLVTLGVVFVSRPATGSQAGTVEIAHASLGDAKLLSAKDCVACHSDLVQQWGQSAHAHAAMDRYYLALATMFIEERGVEAVRYCATCHNPIGLMQGEIDLEAAKRAPVDSDSVYASRKLGVNLPISAHAAEGVTCVTCHRATAIATQPTNGSLKIATGLGQFALGPIAQLSLRAAPAAHIQDMHAASLAQAELCGACHNLHLPNGMPLEPTYNEWKASPYAQQGVTCQSCHMPAMPARKVDSSAVQEVRAHGGFPGAPSSLPTISDSDALLKRAATLAVAVQPANDATQVLATVTVTNSGAGHYLPTGSDDLRQVWLEVSLQDAQGQTLWQSGALDAYGTLDPSTVQFGKVLGDVNGRRIDLHRFWLTTQILSDTRLAPNEVRLIQYAIPLDVQRVESKSLKLTVRLLYRDVPQVFAEIALDKKVSLPTREMVVTSVEINRGYSK